MQQYPEKLGYDTMFDGNPTRRGSLEDGNWRCTNCDNEDRERGRTYSVHSLWLPLRCAPAPFSSRRVPLLSSLHEGGQRQGRVLGKVIRQRRPWQRRWRRLRSSDRRRTHHLRPLIPASCPAALRCALSLLLSAPNVVSTVSHPAPVAVATSCHSLCKTAHFQCSSSLAAIVLSTRSLAHILSPHRLPFQS